MKKFILCAVLFVSLSGWALQAQVKTGPNDIISKDNVTMGVIKTIFENSFYEIKETSETYIQIKDTYSIYIDLDSDNRYLTYSVTWPVNENFSVQDKFNLLNTIGKDVLVVTPYFTESGSSIVIKTTVWLEGGQTVKNLVLTEKIFVKALNLVLDKDTGKIIK